VALLVDRVQKGLDVWEFSFRLQHAIEQLAGDGVSLLDLLPTTSLAGSRREAREFLGAGAVSVNGERVLDGRCLTQEDLLPGGFVFLRRGRRQWHAAQWISGGEKRL
jgi:tyrosyl-tRNA synthetase